MDHLRDLALCLALVGQVVTIVVVAVQGYRRKRDRDVDRKTLTHLHRKADDTHRIALGIGRTVGWGDNFTETRVMTQEQVKR